MWKSPEKRLSLGNRTSSLAGNKNRHSITQSVMAKNRSALVLIYYDQKQQHNKKPQGARETSSGTLCKGTTLVLLR